MPRLLVSIVALAALAAGCTPSADAPPAEASAAEPIAEATPDPSPPRTLRRSLTTPAALDPSRVVDVGGTTVIQDLFEGLYRLGPVGEPVLAAAEKHAISADGLVHTFTLRADARWTDGRPVTAADFAYGWRRTLDPATASGSAAALFAIEGARAFNGASGDAVAAARAAVGVEAVDARTLRVRLERPEPMLAVHLARPSTSPLPRWAIEAHGDGWMAPENIVSNGPWRMTAHQRGRRLEAGVHRQHPDAAALPFDTIEYVVVEDETAAYNLFATDALDYVAGKVPTSVATRLRRAKDPALRAVPFTGVDFYLFNTTRPPFDDPRVRRALSMALDRSAIGSRVLKGGEVSAHSLVPPGLGGIDQPLFDPAGAKALLAEAGYTAETPMRRFTLSHDSSDPARILASYAQQQWQRHLGVQCDLQSVERKVLIGQQRALDYDLSRAAWFADVPDPIEFLEPWAAGSPGNRTGWADAQYDTALTAARAAVDGVERRRQLAAAEARLLAAMPAMPTFVHVRTDLVHARLAGHDLAFGIAQPSRTLRLAD